ncbi:hypothetical protein AVEN_191757-1 [Araneus ventricosus]|uniref:HTH psq-type domain-containing protein n=1 Tax=Araneus ventricosus TaxID=182803 RepID=A0A4Y2RCP2_ARAVE|nr:hypothetical protein AVEN_191757-1 [Araneus ventricosus]
MATRRQISFQDKLHIINEIDDGKKQVEVVKKYGLSLSTIATFLTKRKQIEESVNSNEIKPQRNRLKVPANENIDAAVESILINIENKGDEPFKAVNVKEACDNIAGSWWEVTVKTIRNCREKNGPLFHGGQTN